MLEHAGRFFAGRGMVWTRRLGAPIERVWAAVSTTEGLRKWWIGNRAEIDLQPGGVFRHHWRSTITDLRKYEYIDFESEPGFGGMRFELKADGDGTEFSFIDVMKDENARPKPGPAAGWHNMIDALETYLSGETVEDSMMRGLQGLPTPQMENLVKFYTGYLADLPARPGSVNRKSD